jgi:hypothetical protein
MASPNRGAALLRHYLTARGATLAGLASALDVAPQTPLRWLRGTIPSGGLRYAVAGWTRGHVPPESWDSAEVDDVDALIAQLKGAP